MWTLVIVNSKDTRWTILLFHYFYIIISFYFISLVCLTNSSTSFHKVFEFVSALNSLFNKLLKNFSQTLMEDCQYSGTSLTMVFYNFDTSLNWKQTSLTKWIMYILFKVYESDSIVFRRNRGTFHNSAFLKYLPLKLKNCFWLIMSISQKFLLCKNKKKYLVWYGI